MDPRTLAQQISTFNATETDELDLKGLSIDEQQSILEVIRKDKVC